MNRHRLSRLISHIYKPELDPRRAPRVYHEFDVERGYGRYHDTCRAAFARDDAPPGNGPLKDRGFAYARVLGREQAEDLLRDLRADKGISTLKKNTKHLEGYRITRAVLGETLLPAVLTSEVDRRLSGFFASEYLVHWATFTVTQPAQEQASVSFRWHCDKGPTAHLKLIVYLNGTDEHGGNTEFVPLTETARVGAKGYLFGRTRNRTGDVRHLSRIAEHEVSAHAQPMTAGDGVIFQPATVLHRGIGPRLGPRYAITLCLLPSPVHWREALAKDVICDLAVDEKWYSHASEILAAVRG